MSSIRLSVPSNTSHILEEMEESLFMNRQDLLSLAIVNLYSEFRSGEISFKTPISIDNPKHPHFTKTTSEEEKDLEQALTEPSVSKVKPKDDLKSVLDSWK